MKRRKPLKRKARLQQGKPLAPGKPLRQRQGLHRTRRVGLRPGERAVRDAAAQAWWLYAVRQGCVLCAHLGRKPVERIEGHHVLSQQAIKAWVRTQAKLHGWDELDQLAKLHSLLWDTRNAMGLCSTCHQAHTRGARRVPLALVRAEAIEFAQALGKVHILRRQYAPATSEAA